MINSLNTSHLGVDSSFIQVNPDQFQKFDSNQSNQGISEKQLDQLLTQFIFSMLLQDDNADDSPNSDKPTDFPSPRTQMLMNVIGDILQAKNGGRLGGLSDGWLNTSLSLSGDTASMQ
ncbi:XopA/Hpa1 family type III secretion system protein [Xanthomonas euvesicatoria]|uniref:XopA/Hpa1 family type III secretion system protein n=1 Tax=Xanthomonas euvesicatoria TaxID=456327 RepID=UPI000F8EC4DD|nr:XopA/Hpa1 family type III secretion system protein [Xanthomonas euvesicatoria]